MGLSAHEQRVLETIEDRLAGSDPGLALKLATFSRLNADGGSPVRERIGVARQWVTRRPPRSRRGQGRGRTCRRAPKRSERLRWRLAPALLWLVVSVTLISVGAVLGQRGGGACPGWASARAPACAVGMHKAPP